MDEAWSLGQVRINLAWTITKRYIRQTRLQQELYQVLLCQCYSIQECVFYSAQSLSHNIWKVNKVFVRYSLYSPSSVQKQFAQLVIYRSLDHTLMISQQFVRLLEQTSNHLPALRFYGLGISQLPLIVHMMQVDLGPQLFITMLEDTCA